MEDLLRYRVTITQTAKRTGADGVTREVEVQTAHIVHSISQTDAENFLRTRFNRNAEIVAVQL